MRRMADRDQQGPIRSRDREPGIDPERREDVAAMVDQVAEIGEIPEVDFQIMARRHQRVQQSAWRVHRLSAYDNPIPCPAIR